MMENNPSEAASIRCSMYKLSRVGRVKDALLHRQLCGQHAHDV